MSNGVRRWTTLRKEAARRLSMEERGGIGRVQEQGTMARDAGKAASLANIRSGDGGGERGAGGERGGGVRKRGREKEREQKRKTDEQTDRWRDGQEQKGETRERG